MSAAGRRDPYLDFRFQVEIDSLVVGGFSEVSGLAAELETEEYQEGGVNDHSHTLPKRFGHSTVTLKRGLTDAVELWGWVKRVRSGRFERRNVRVVLLDERGAETWGWECKNALPVRWAGPEMSGDGSSVALETLEFEHDGLGRMEGKPTG